MSPVGRATQEHSSGESELGRAIDRTLTSTTTQLKVLACVLIALMVFGTGPRASAQAGSVVYTFGSTISDNLSNYTLFYTIPPVIHAGVKTNMSFFVYVTVLSGWKIQSQRQILQVIINTATSSVTTTSVQNSVILYQGGRWGPFNVTMDLNDSQVGLSPGQVTNATVFASLVVYEQYDNPAYPFVVDSGSTLQLTNVQLAATPRGPGSSGDRLFMSFAVGAAVVVALAGVVLVTRRRGQPGTSDQGPGDSSRSVNG
jgi:hypothetical protein